MAIAMALVVTQGAFARMKDKPNFGYCPDGKKTTDINKCKTKKN
jgi:hypothetical protein